MNRLQTELCEAFLLLDEQAQMERLQRDGVYIGKQTNHPGTVLLYQYQSIYIEVWYSHHRLHIKKVICHTDPSILDHYFDE